MTKSTLNLWRFLRRLCRDLAILLLIGVVLAAIITWLPPSPESPRPGRESDSDDRPGAGITVRFEAMDIWLPQRLVDRARREFRPGVVHRHEQLRKIPEDWKSEDAFYAVAGRGDQVNGGTAEVVFLRHPYREPEHLQECLDVLATAEGNPPRIPAMDYTAAAVHIIPPNMSHQELTDAIRTNPAALFLLDAAVPDSESPR